MVVISVLRHFEKCTLMYLVLLGLLVGTISPVMGPRNDNGDCSDWISLKGAVLLEQ